MGCPIRRCLIGLAVSCGELRLPCFAFSQAKTWLGRSCPLSPVWDASIVAEATTARGFRTVRVGKRNSAQNALAANRAAAFGGISLRAISPRRAVAAIGLGIRRFHPNGHNQNAHARDGAHSALHG